MVSADTTEKTVVEKNVIESGSGEEEATEAAMTRAKDLVTIKLLNALKLKAHTKLLATPNKVLSAPLNPINTEEDPEEGVVIDTTVIILVLPDN